MRAYFGNDTTGADVQPAFRLPHHGPTLVAARLSIPLRFEDLISILYHASDVLTDSDTIREHIMDALVNQGGRSIAADKRALESSILAGTADVERLAVCQRRITSLFGQPSTFGSARTRSPIIGSVVRRRAA
jgi:hypothetical protein